MKSSTLSPARMPAVFFRVLKSKCRRLLPLRGSLLRESGGLLTVLVLLSSSMLQAQGQPLAAQILDAHALENYVDEFNSMIDEVVINSVPNSEALPWLKKNIPLFECPDKALERTYYYRWWSYRKHIKKTPKGFIITEFIRPVGHATEYNAISCAAGHHFSEGRWLHTSKYLDDYALFWLRSGKDGGLQKGFHRYSGWISDALYSRYLVNLDRDFLVSLLDSLILDFETWEKERLAAGGLFWQHDVWDGMEESVSGSRTARNIRPTINSYMFGNAGVISKIAVMAGKPGVAARFEQQARTLKKLVQTRLWDKQAQFFKALLETGKLADVRELIGYTPWYFNLPDPGYEEAWRQLMDPEGFYAPYGPTTAEQRHPGFRIAYEGDDCQWNGPSWPFSTSITLTALANLLHNYEQHVISKEDYFQTLQIYSCSQRRKLADGRVIPWIDENLNPFSGEWHARLLKIRKGKFDRRGDHYNHSTFCDLIISGVVGVIPRPDEIVEVDPLLPAETWDWFCLDNVLYHGRILTIFWDRTGSRYGKGAGFQLFVDGRRIAHSKNLSKISGSLAQN